MTAQAQQQPATWGGIARIMLWALAFLYAAGALLPKPDEPMPFMGGAATKDVRAVATIPEDPRFVRFPPRHAGLNIQWINDSTGAIFRTDPDMPFGGYTDTQLVAALARDAIAQKTGSDIGIDANIQPDMGPVEMYSSVAAAIAQKPDMIVLSVSPYWVFNGYEIVKRQAHLNTAPALWAQHMASWPWLITLASPANNLWAMAAAHIPVIRDSSAYRGIVERRKMMLPQKLRPATAAGVDLSSGTRSTLGFWVCEGALKGDCDAIRDDSGKRVNLRTWYGQMMDISELDGHGMTQAAFAKTLSILHDSGIPSLVYRIPVPKEMTDNPGSRAQIDKIEAVMQAYAAQYKDSNIHIVPQVPEDIVATATFRENDNSAHMTDAGQYPAWLAGRVADILQERNTGK